MKKLSIHLIIFSSLIVSCHPKEISREEALRLIHQEKSYPSVVDYDIYCSDPKYGRKVLDAGLEAAGLVTVLHTQKLADVGKPMVTFTTKAQPFLLLTSEKDKAVHIQKVKLADEEILGVVSITNGTGNKAIVEYTTQYKNVTPFSTLTSVDFNKDKTHKAYFTLNDQGWKLQKKPDVDFMKFDQ